MGRWYEPTRPLEAKGGIKAQSKSGGFGKSWWAKRWVATLESFDLGARLKRGGSYARRGQVLDIEIDQGAVRAKVQGSRPSPYTVEVNVKTLPEKQWREVADALAGQALFAAKLMNGEMPDDIEDVLGKIGISLLPNRRQDLTTSCSCPDYSNPCKHIAAVYYLVGEEFDRDPFLIFRMRGVTREAFLDMLAERICPQADVEDVSETIPPEPLIPDAMLFWRGSPAPDDLFGEVSVPPVTAALPKRLGGFPFWRGGQTLAAIMEPVYAAAARSGLDLFVGEAREGGGEQIVNI